MRKLAASRHGLADWITHARIVARSWKPSRRNRSAAPRRCDGDCIASMRRGWADRPRAGRPRRLTEAERSKIIALGRTPPPGRLSTQADGTMGARDEDSSAQWSLDALAQAAKAADIRVKRSQIRLADLSGITPSPRDAATVI